MTVALTKHEWEKLYTYDEEVMKEQFDPWAPVYAGIDMCKNCRAIRYNTEGGPLPDWVKEKRPFFYMARGWLSPEEPPCE